jgi:signal transduction histidine kinase
MSMARLSRDQGRRDEAYDLLAPVYNWLAEGFDTLDPKEAKDLARRVGVVPPLGAKQTRRQLRPASFFDPEQDFGCLAARSVWTAVRAIASCGWSCYAGPHRAEELLRMNESIHGERTVSEPQDRVTELIEQQAAISDVLHIIASPPHDLQPVFDAILDRAIRLCGADICSLRLSEESGLRRVALRGSPLLVSRVSSFPVLAENRSHLSRIATSRLPTHIPDFAAVEGDLRDDFWKTVVDTGFRTSLFVPLLKDNEIVGIVTLGRKQVQPFTDNQISLFRDFSAQATIALEGTRRERRYREMQMELVHINRLATIGQLTASITHEVNQPLAAARNNLTAALNFLDRTPPDLVEVREALASAVKDNDRASNVVRGIRALIQKAPTRADSVDLSEAVREVLELTRGEALKRGVSVRTQLADGLPLIQGDRVQLQQVVLNLILNAVQAMGAVADRTRELMLITIRQTEPNAVCLGVRDTGPGLSAETLPRLFEPFYTTKPDGMGMGLSICRSIIEAHGGRLWATRCEPRGALFQFTIPAD